MNKYFSKHENYLKIINHENDCYVMWKTKKIIEENEQKEEEELMRSIKKTILGMKQANTTEMSKL